jgi:hypothetical protein
MPLTTQRPIHSSNLSVPLRGKCNKYFESIAMMLQLQISSSYMSIQYLRSHESNDLLIMQKLNFEGII